MVYAARVRRGGGSDEADGYAGHLKDLGGDEKAHSYLLEFYDHGKAFRGSVSSARGAIEYLWKPPAPNGQKAVMKSRLIFQNPPWAKTRWILQSVVETAPGREGTEIFLRDASLFKEPVPPK